MMETDYEQFNDTDPAFGGHTERALHQAFDQVCDPSNWKLPIDATVPADADQNLIYDACLFFAASPPEIFPEGDHLRVTAAGYYACVGS